MRIHLGTELIRNVNNPVLTTGTFDGVHFGHQKINLHQIDRTIDPRAKAPTTGSGDFCLMDRQVVDAIGSLPEPGRYLRGEMARYPTTPLGYFDSRTEQRLAAFGEKAAGARDPALLEEFPGSGMLRPRSVRRLTSSGVAVIRNWLSSIATRKGEGAWAS